VPVADGISVTAVGILVFGEPVAVGFAAGFDGSAASSVAVGFTVPGGGRIEPSLRNDDTSGGDEVAADPFRASPGTNVTTVEKASVPESFCFSSLAHFLTAASRRSGAWRGPASTAANRRAHSASEIEVRIFSVGMYRICVDVGVGYDRLVGWAASSRLAAINAVEQAD